MARDLSQDLPLIEEENVNPRNVDAIVKKLGLGSPKKQVVFVTGAGNRIVKTIIVSYDQIAFHKIAKKELESDPEITRVFEDFSNNRFMGMVLQPAFTRSEAVKYNALKSQCSALPPKERQGCIAEKFKEFQEK